jgi:geranylgeranylglycerol-phosphate geranylgeranyltransferase
MVITRFGSMGNLRGYLSLIRPVNCLMMGFAVIVGAALAGHRVSDSLWQSLVYGFITGFMLTAASMAVNDYYDREIDAINEPDRPIPSGLTKPREALTLASILAIMGFAAASANSYLTNSALCFVIAMLAWTISVAYTTAGKRSGLPGNFLVSACVAVPFIYGSAAVANAIESNVLVFVSIVFLSITGREVTKGIVDVEGDRRRGVKTLAARYGEKKAAIVATLFYLSAISLSPIPRLLDLVSVWFIPLVAITDLGLAASSFMLLKDHSRDKARRIKNAVLVWCIFGLLAFIAGAMKV